jgi:hypothetical protein
LTSVSRTDELDLVEIERGQRLGAKAQLAEQLAPGIDWIGAVEPALVRRPRLAFGG